MVGHSKVPHHYNQMTVSYSRYVVSVRPSLFSESNNQGERLLRALCTIHRIHNGALKTSDRGWIGMSVLMALMQNCKMASASSNSMAVVLTENDIPGAALERRKPAKLEEACPAKTW